MIFCQICQFHSQIYSVNAKLPELGRIYPVSDKKLDGKRNVVIHVIRYITHFRYNNQTIFLLIFFRLLLTKLVYHIDHHCSKFSPFLDNGSDFGSLESRSLGSGFITLSGLIHFNYFVSHLFLYFFRSRHDVLLFKHASLSQTGSV